MLKTWIWKKKSGEERILLWLPLSLVRNSASEFRECLQYFLMNFIRPWTVRVDLEKSASQLMLQPRKLFHLFQKKPFSFWKIICRNIYYPRSAQLLSLESLSKAKAYYRWMLLFRSVSELKLKHKTTKIFKPALKVVCELLACGFMSLFIIFIIITSCKIPHLL